MIIVILSKVLQVRECKTLPIRILLRISVLIIGMLIWGEKKGVTYSDSNVEIM